MLQKQNVQYQIYEYNDCNFYHGRYFTFHNMRMG